MHLKEVRMENFKSFGQGLTVPFKPGFTAITGPNGSGKSNIGDAILFVLGPRSARMIRAQKLTDLIFNGGKNKKAAKECEVSLVFDNHDRMMPVEADEVVLTRRIRKAPKRGMPDNYYSYFYVNGRSASLKEFVDLLQHARISADGYNIVTQGAVTQMVEMSNMDRRGVLDSIAGITEFDGDIEKAEKRKLEVEQNLERINIILGEIRRSLSDLKRERDQALEYAELKGRQDQLKTIFAFRRKEEIEQQIADVQKEIESRQASKAEFVQKLEELRQELKQSTRAKQEIEEKLASLGGAEGEKTREEIKALQAEAVRFEERMNYSRDEVKDLTNDRRTLEQERTKLAKEIDRLEAESAKAQAELDQWTKALSQAESDLKSVRDLIGSSDEGSLKINQELAKLKADYEETTTKIHQRRLEQDRYTEKRQAVEARIAELEEARSRYEFEIKDIDFQVENLEKEVNASQSGAKSTEKSLFDARKRQAAITEELNTLEAAVRRLQREYHELKAKEDASATVGQGLTRAVEEVLQARAKGHLKGIHGTIAELGKARESKHETALQIAAGNRMMSIVVEDDEAAASAIEFLRSRNLGRAAFLPLNKMIPAKPRGKALMAVKDKASLGFAIDLIEFSRKYESAFSYVFGDTLVMSELASARRLMGGVRMVTLQGDLLEPSGAMIGGSLSKKDSSLRFAGKDLSKLTDVEAELNTAVAHQEQLTEDLVKVRSEISALEAAFSETRAKEGDGFKLKDLVERKKEFDAKIKGVATELEGKRQELAGLEDALAKNEERIATMAAHVETLEAGRKEKSKLLIKGTKKEWADKATKLEAAVADAQKARFESESKVQTLANQAALVAERAAEIDARITKIIASVEEHQKEAEGAKKSFADLEIKIKALTKAETAMSGQAKELGEKRDKLTEKVAALNSKTDTLLNKIDTTDALVATAKNRLPTLEEGLGEVLVELSELGAKEPPEDMPNLQDAKAELQAVQSKMRALEPVNMLALEEYEKQMGREGELIVEVDRLTVQRDNLVKVVEEIVEKKKAGLMKVFEAVNKNLKEVYARMTEGGEAYIELENPERPFEAGLVLKAKPKGKKVARLQALSGGEKSMAALAFIFAIQEFEPSPFYVLDEVDMFLDGVNSELVAEMVKENSRRAQFIMVSLRKVTLKEADHIYGVTMAGDGLSQMIANFDINMITEEGELVAGATGAGTLRVNKGGDEGGAGGADGRGIRDTVKDMVKVEVGK